MCILLLFMLWALVIIVNACSYIVHSTRTSMYIGYWNLNKYYYYNPHIEANAERIV